jgi:hypothetical protein
MTLQTKSSSTSPPPARGHGCRRVQQRRGSGRRRDERLLDPDQRHDPFPTPILQNDDYGMSCRIYRDKHGQAVQAPSADQLRDAVIGATVVAAM